MSAGYCMNRRDYSGQASRNKSSNNCCVVGTSLLTLKKTKLCADDVDVPFSSTSLNVF